MALVGKKIVLAVTGSIAAYKSATFVRLLKKQGAEVKVIMTTSASLFISPLTLSTLSGENVIHGLIDSDNDSWNNHVELGLWADLFIVAPATANTLAKMAHGICDNMLLATYLSARSPVVVCPAMDLDMYAHPTTQSNLAILAKQGVHLIAPEEGGLASGLVGKGRMAEPENIVEAITSHFFSPTSNSILSGKKALLTVGPTREYIDPVRYITNGSSGKMGISIAQSLMDRGVEVTIIAGPLSVAIPSGLHAVSVTSAQEMHDAFMDYYDDADLAIFTAAVADYKPLGYSQEKIKKKKDSWELKFEKNPDIAAEAGKKKKKQINIGFALETHDEQLNAKQKLERKNFDAIVLNSMNDKGAGFEVDTNKVSLITSQAQKDIPLKSKQEVAEEIVSFIEEEIMR